MKNLKSNLFIVVLFTCSFGFSTVRICGNHTYPDGHTARVCHYFYAADTTCDSADMLAIVSQPGGFTGGWTCQSDNFGIAATNSGDAKLVRSQDGKAFLTVNGETTQVASDAFAGFIDTVQRETANRRVNTQVIQNEIDTFLDSDSGFVSNERLRVLSLELGVPVAVTRGWNPRDEPGYHQSKWTGKAAEPSDSASSGSRRPDQCSLPDCSCRVVDASRASLCEGGTEEETEAGVHYCKCGRFGPSTIQAGGAGGSFTVGGAGAIGQIEHAEGGMSSVAKPRTPTPQPTHDIDFVLQAQRQQISTPTPWVNGPAEMSAQSAGGRQEKGTGETCIAEYETAFDVDIFFRQDRMITGVWRAKQDNGAKRERPEYVFADANGCLYGCTGNVWEPLDCPGRDFSNPSTYPRAFKMEASCSLANTSDLAWHRVNESRGRAMEAPPQQAPSSRFALAQQTSRPAERGEPESAPVIPQVYCQVGESANGKIPGLKCCSAQYVTNTDGTATTMRDHTVVVGVACTSGEREAMPNVQDGSIVLRTADGKDYCLNPNGLFGACAARRGIKEKGIK